MKEFWNRKITYKIIKEQEEVYAPISFLVPVIGFINLLKLDRLLEELNPIQKNKIFNKR